MSEPSALACRVREGCLWEIDRSVSTEIFVFGSNREGRHGKGAALHARQKYGAIYGQPKGRQGNSYAIITKELRKDHLPVALFEIKDQIDEFIGYAVRHPDLTFIVTRIGCGLAGFRDEDIAPMFRFAPSNCVLPREWERKFK